MLSARAGMDPSLPADQETLNPESHGAPDSSARQGHWCPTGAVVAPLAGFMREVQALDARPSHQKVRNSSMAEQTASAFSGWAGGYFR